MNKIFFLGIAFFMSSVSYKNNKKIDFSIIQSSENIDYSSPEYNEYKFQNSNSFADAEEQVIGDSTDSPTKKITIQDLIAISKRQEAAIKQHAKNAGKQFEATSRNPYMAYKTYEFDQYKTNYDRFKNSPCFQKLGFDAIKAMNDSVGLEKEYQACEKEYRKVRNTKTSVYITTSLLLIIAFGILIRKYYLNRTH